MCVYIIIGRMERHSGGTNTIDLLADITTAAIFIAMSYASSSHALPSLLDLY